MGRVSTHPPIFTAMCRRLSPRHPANILARRIAFREEHIPIIMARPVYYPRDWNERD